MTAVAELERPAARKRARGVVQKTPPPAVIAVGPSSHIRRAVTINLRAPIQARELIDSAAAVEGKTRTEFMLDSACRRAEEVLLEKRVFVLAPDKYDELMQLLEAPPAPRSALRQLLLGKAPWEK
ncbi:MAG: DUF1778 domain-containing protein [Stellaceae bacterium]